VFEHQRLRITGLVAGAAVDEMRAAARRAHRSRRRVALLPAGGPL